jgi:hypothetical protein
MGRHRVYIPVAAEAKTAESMARRWSVPGWQDRLNMSPPHATRDLKAAGLHLYVTSAYFLQKKTQAKQAKLAAKS